MHNNYSPFVANMCTTPEHITTIQDELKSIDGIAYRQTDKGCIVDCLNTPMDVTAAIYDVLIAHEKAGHLNTFWRSHVDPDLNGQSVRELPIHLYSVPSYKHMVSFLITTID